MARLIIADQEKQMILAAQRGGADGYKYLMDRYGRQVQLLVAQMVSDVRDAEELTQDAFVRAFTHLSDFDPERASFTTWLSRIAYNTALNHLRSRGMASMPLDEERYRPPDGALWAQDEEETAAQNERLMLLDKAIDCLRPEERTLLHLHYYEERSLAEIAEVMDVAAGPLANRPCSWASSYGLGNRRISLRQSLQQSSPSFQSKKPTRPSSQKSPLLRII